MTKPEADLSIQQIAAKCASASLIDSCEFGQEEMDKGFCAFQSTPNLAGVWKKSVSGNVSHTYLYAPSSEVDSGVEKFHIYSPKLHNISEGPYAMEFWYYLDEDFHGTLNIYHVDKDWETGKPLCNDVNSH